MPSTYTLISSNTLTGSAASVTFSAIPSTYTDLVLRVSARNDSALSTQTSFINVVINGVTTGSTYSWTFLSTGNVGNNPQSSRAANISAKIKTVGDSSGGMTANSFGSAELYFPNYTGATAKPIGSFGVGESNTANIAYGVSVNAALWNSTSAITSIQLFPDDGTGYVTGSSFYLYGIKNS